MKKVELISVGELKFKELQELEKLYARKISYFVEFSSRSLKDVKIQDEEQKKKKEGEMMGQLLAPKDFVIALDQYGKKMDSVKFAGFLEDKLAYGSDRVVFLIGGHAGLAGSLDARINFKLSFSDMTFGHDIFRVLFLEQLYRAFTIIKGIKYHR
ncbi:MAG TPA: 23S rRNA (pseudouridine(1915)-N(3))-methyltransferase RlmH [Candidatus Kapabacteria bacterium]|nr:23S rRNA (pseudouridine(1915)-N(3))-methyltransferase RlmH [Candidatus Kapabacteria bacterium]